MIMQEFRHEARGDIQQCFGQAETQKLLEEKMNSLQSEMSEKGFVETKRKKLGRNDACPCGSGNKFKKCCISKLK